MLNCNTCKKEIRFFNKVGFGKGKQIDGTEICTKCFNIELKIKHKPFLDLINGRTEDQPKNINQNNIEIVDLELNAMQKLQFKKFISEQSGMSLSEVDNYLLTISEVENEELIKNFKNQNVKKPGTQITSTTQVSSNNSNSPSCPKCRSKSIHADKKGFSGKKACCGAILAGPFGLLCGGHKANKVRLTCLNCKHSW